MSQTREAFQDTPSQNQQLSLMSTAPADPSSVAQSPVRFTPSGAANGEYVESSEGPGALENNEQEEEEDVALVSFVEIANQWDYQCRFEETTRKWVTYSGSSGLCAQETFDGDQGDIRGQSRSFTR